MMVISNGQPASVTWDYDRVANSVDNDGRHVGGARRVGRHDDDYDRPNHSKAYPDCMDNAVSNQLDPIVIPGHARRLAIRNDHHCFSNLETGSFASKSDLSMTANIVSRALSKRDHGNASTILQREVYCGSILSVPAPACRRASRP